MMIDLLMVLVLLALILVGLAVISTRLQRVYQTLDHRAYHDAYQRGWSDAMKEKQSYTMDGDGA